jgi:two-component system, NtrC family, nitrogen regulation response regulator NtrX
MANVLIVDDQVDIRNLLSDILNDEGYNTGTASNASGAIAEVERFSPDVVILDIWLEGSDLDGIGVLKKLRSINPLLPVIMISGHGNIETALQTIRLGAYDFIEKPFKAEKLLILVNRAISSYNLKKLNLELKKLNDVNSDYIAASKSSLALLQTAKTIALSNSRVLISGDPGTGKDVLARFIHENSHRAMQPFVALHASNIKEEDFEEGMFGDGEGGSYKNSLLNKANGGTLYIDDISEMSPGAQSKFLRVLQESNGTKKYDIRIITSTTKDMASEIGNGNLNQSLYYRINVAWISIEPLKQRKADIIMLINYFIDRFSQTLVVKKISLSEEALNILELYGWPGNVRQLKNIIEWLMIIHAKQKSYIEAEDLPKELVSTPSPANINLIHPNLFSRTIKEARDEFEKEYLVNQLSRFSGNISKTSEFIGMDRTALYRKLKLLKIV